MNDLLKRLRAMPSSFNDALRIMDEAADHIETLEAQLKIYRAREMDARAASQAFLAALDKAAGK
jgi:hypothetical protein